MFQPRKPVGYRSLLSRRNGKSNHTSADHRLEQRQVRAAEFGALTTAILTAVVALIAYLQWNTSESTARIERAKALPHFRINQTPYLGLSGFLPKVFRVDAVAGVADASEAVSSEIFLIHFFSKSLKTFGICRASSSGFYAYNGDLMNFSLSDGAQSLIDISKKTENDEDTYKIQPLSTVVSVDFTDIFGTSQSRNLMFMGGTSTQVSKEDFAADGWTSMDLSLQTGADGNLTLFRSNDGVISQDCANALRIMSKVRSVRVADNYVFPTDKSYIIYQGAFFESGSPRITRENPHPVYLATGEGGKGHQFLTRKATEPFYALPQMGDPSDKSAVAP